MSGVSPTLRQRELGLRLRKLRTGLGMTVEEVADKLLCSPAKVSRMETAARRPSPRDVRDLCALYGVDESGTAELMQLARQAREQGWWTKYEDLNLSPYLGLEQEASSITCFCMYYIPGLVQTEDYARAMIAETAGRSFSEDGRRFAILAERQRQSMTNAPRVWVVLDEAALRRQVGGPEVMRAQLEYLCDLRSSRGIFLQVIPFAGEPQACMDSPFTILGFPDRMDPNVVCLRYPTGVMWVEDLAEVDRYHVFFHHLQAAALSFDDSVSLMTSALKDL